MTRNRLAILITCLATAGLLSAACSDDTESGPKKDKGAPDMGVADVGVDGATPDQKVSPDQKATPDKKITPDMPLKPKGIACTKDTDCYPTAPFCDTTAKVCVECVKDADCKDNTTGAKCGSNGVCTCAADTDCASTKVFGNKCFKTSTGNLCGCKATADCAKSIKGPTCSSTSGGYCSCKANTDCKTGTFTVCSKAGSTATSISFCNQACKTDTECAKEIDRKVCDTTAGGCVACNKSADCAYASTPFYTTCTTKKFCVECEKTADCTAKSLGNTCSTQGWCECANDAACASNNNGKKCDSSYKACSCKTAADCPTGKKCVGNPYLPSLMYCK